MIYWVKYLSSAEVVVKNKVMISLVHMGEKDSAYHGREMSKGFTHYRYFAWK